MLRGQKRTPDWLERGKPVLLSFPLLGDDGKTVVVPASGKVFLYNPAGTKIIDNQDTTTRLVDPRTGLEVPSGDPKGVQAASYLTTLAADSTLGPRWLVEWALVVDSQTITYKHEAAVVKQACYPMVGEDDLIKGRHRGLDLVLQDAQNDTLADYIDTAWEKLVGLLIMDNRYPYQLLSSWALREPHITKALELLFFDAATNSPANGSYPRIAKQYGEEFLYLWGSFVATFDKDDDGLPGPTEPPQTSGQSGLAGPGALNIQPGDDVPASYFDTAGGWPNGRIGNLPGRGW